MKQIIKRIQGELRFLNCQGIKHFVKMADIGTCHRDCPTIENRKEKLKKELKALSNALDEQREEK